MNIEQRRKLVAKWHSEIPAPGLQDPLPASGEEVRMLLVITYVRSAKCKRERHMCNRGLS
jgi:hypothetical protein